MGAESTCKRSAFQWLLIPLFLLLIPVILLWMLCRFVICFAVLVVVWVVWSARGVTMLTVYSNSPHWQHYFEAGLLPLVEKRSKVLNWSERANWPVSLETIVFSLFSGQRDFNPMIFIFPILRWPRKLRFYQPFRDGRHGKTALLCDLEKELSVLIDQPITLDHLHPRASA